MPLIDIEIVNEGGHWDKGIRILGIEVYHRHDHAKDNGPERRVGFNAGLYCSGEIWDE